MLYMRRRIRSVGLSLSTSVAVLCWKYLKGRIEVGSIDEEKKIEYRESRSWSEELNNWL